MSRVSFIRNLHIRIKKGVISPPVGYAAILRVGVPSDPPRKERIETVESPILGYAQQFAEKHKEIGFLSDGRLSQDAYNFAGLKLSYLKKGLNENQADIQAKRDVVKNLEIRSMELDLIQNQALKIGVPSFQPKTHLEHIESLQQKILERKREYNYIEKRENLEGALSIKFQYSDVSPLSFSQVSMFTPVEYFIFIKEHPEFHKVLLQPIRPDEESVVPEDLKKPVKETKSYDDEDGEFEDNDRGDDGSPVDSASEKKGNLGFSISDYYLSKKNVYFDSRFPIGLGDIPSLNNSTTMNSRGEKVEIKDTEKLLLNHIENYKQGRYTIGSTSDLQVDDNQLEQEDFDEQEEEEDYDEQIESNEIDQEQLEYENKLDQSKLGQDDICIDLFDLKNVPSKIERNKLLEEKIKKNFYSKDSLTQSKINVEQGRFIYQDNAFPSAADISLGKFARLPTVSAIKTLRHLLASGNISKELLQYLEKDESNTISGGNQEQYQDEDRPFSSVGEISKNYVLSDLSNIETLSHLKRYNEIPANDKLESSETDLKEAHINTILNVTDTIYTTPIVEQRMLKKKFGDDFIFEENSIENPNQPIDPLLQSIATNNTTVTVGSKKGPIIYEDGLIDLKNTNIFSKYDLYESHVTNKYINKLEKQIEKQDSLLKQQQSSQVQAAQAQKEISFQDILSNESIEIAQGKSTIDPSYLLEVNKNRGSLLNNNKQVEKKSSSTTVTEEIKSKPLKSTSFKRFYENYVLPNDIKGYAEYHGKSIIKKQDAERSSIIENKLQQLKEENKDSLFSNVTNIDSSSFEGPAQARIDTLKKKLDRAYDKYEKYDIQLEILAEIEKNSKQTHKDKLKQHVQLYPEYYNDKGALSQKQTSESLLKQVINSTVSHHKLNAAASFDQEDKVDFRTLQLSPEIELKFKNEIAQFREKDSRGQITMEDSYEFTNYINYLIDNSNSTPVIQSIKNFISLRSKNNELIDQFNSTLEQQTSDVAVEEHEDQIENTFKQLEQLYPDETDRERFISEILIQSETNDKFNKINDHLLDIDSKLSNNPINKSNITTNNSTLADYKVAFSKKDSTNKNKFDINFNDIDQ